MIKNYQIISDYKHNHTLRSLFNKLTQDTFNFNLEKWYQKGYWDDRYICHSILYDNQIISNVSTTLFDIVINGSIFKAIQIGTVMTKDHYRGNKLSVVLLEHVLNRYSEKCDFFYLFANKDVWAFYEKLGFSAVSEYSYTSKLIKKNRKHISFLNLNLDNPSDESIIINLIRRRQPVSKIFGVPDNESIVLFHYLYAHSDDIYYVPDLECLIIVSFENDTYSIFDIVCENIIDHTVLFDIITSINNEISYIQYNFTPDYHDIDIEVKPELSSDKMFFKGDSSILPDRFVYPKIAQT